MDPLLALHDQLLALKPEDVDHPQDCPWCAGADLSSERGENLDTFTQEDLDAAVALALKPLQDELASHKTKQGQEEAQAQIALVQAEADTKIAEIQAQLDSKVLEASEAQRTLDETLAYLEAALQEQAVEGEKAARREERLNTVREVASFPDEYVDANIDRWSSLVDEDFEALVSDWRAIAKREPEAKELPKATAMVASRNDTGRKPAYAEIFGLVQSGANLKTLKGV